MTKMRRLLSIFLIIGMMATLITGINVNAEETVTAVYDLASSNETTVAVKFSEAVSADAVSGVTLTDCETLTAATISSVTQVDDTTVALNADGLKYGAEYKLSIPAGIAAVSGNTTSAQEMYINAYNPTTIVPGGVPKAEDEIVLEDGFEDYEIMTTSSNNESRGDKTTADTTKWSIEDVKEWHLGTVIAPGNGGKILRNRPKQSEGVVLLNPAALIGETITSGVTEIYFDAAFCNPESNDAVMRTDDSKTTDIDESTLKSENYILITLGKEGVKDDYPVLRIDREDIRLFDKGVYNYLLIEGYKNQNDLTKFNKYKLIIDMDGGQISLAIHNGTDYEIVKNTEIKASTLGTNGFDRVKLGHYKTTTKGTVNENTMSAFDNVKIIKKAKNQRTLIEDNFEDYTSYKNYSKDTSPPDNYLEMREPKKWTRGGTVNTSWGFNSYVCSYEGNKVLKQDAWQWTKAVNTSATSVPLSNAVSSGVIELTFDASVKNPESNITNGYSNYYLASIVNGSGEKIPALKIASNDVNTNNIIAYPVLGGEELQLDYTNKNGWGNFDSFKIILNYNVGKTETYILDNAEYVKVAEGVMPASLLKAGYTGLEFKFQKCYNSGANAAETGSLTDNVKVIVKDEPAIYEFEDDFSDYNAYAGTSNSCGDAKYYVSQLSNPKWINGGWSTWGINSYVALYNGEKVLKQDIFQTTGIGETNVTTTALAESANTGVAEIVFDLAVQDLNETGNNWYFVGLKDGNLNYMPIMKVNKTEISVTPAIDDSYSEVVEGYTNANNLTTFNRYKVVLDFDKGTTELIILDDTDFVSVAKGTMNSTLKETGIKQVVFGYKKGEKSPDKILETTSALLDNVKFNVTEKKVSTPVVKSVRIDGAATSNSVPTKAKTVKIYFSRTVNSKSLDGITISGVNASKAYNKDDNSYTLTINEELNPMTTYTINIPTTVTDIDGNSLGRAYAGTFKTAKGEFAIKEFSLKEGEEDATYENTAVGDTLTAKVAIKNYALKEGTYVLAYAIYDGDSLAMIECIPVPYSASELTTSKTLDIPIPATVGKLGVKVMLWDGFGNSVNPVLKPIVLQ